jgi:hypothetical protein
MQSAEDEFLAESKMEHFAAIGEMCMELGTNARVARGESSKTPDRGDATPRATTKQRDEVARRLYQANAMPECAEQLCAQVYCHLRCLYLGGAVKDEEQWPLGRIAAGLARLPALLQGEGLHNSSFPADIAQATRLMQQGDIEAAARCCDRVLKELCPLNIQEVRYWLRGESAPTHHMRYTVNTHDALSTQVLFLVQKTEEAGAAIEGKDVVLLLGRTGAGKSTLMHYLAGSRMQYEREGSDHVIPASLGCEALRSVCVGGTAESETRYISVVPVQAGRMLTRKELFLCDTPGFDDTMGAEV